MRRLFLLLLLAPLACAGGHVRPRWAMETDQTDSSGHTFVCEGAGSDEATAMTTAFGVCNDKICKVCGVEIESVLKTKENLSGVSMERQVVERCRRVRKSEPVVRWKSVDCGPGGCRAYVQVFYSKADEEAECPRYASEKFADPSQCEADVDAFMAIEGHSAASFAARREAIDRALPDCKNIDVRPTPQLTAVEAKLHKGLDRFETNNPVSDARALVDWMYFTQAAKGWRDDLRMTRTLEERLQKIRDLVHDRFLVFTVFEAARADDLDSPTGIARLLAALQAAPSGAHFGALDDVHFEALRHFWRGKADSTPIGDFIRKRYPPDSLTRQGYPEVSSTDAVARVVGFFASDGTVTADEWDYALRIPEIGRNVAYLPRLTRAPRHGGDEVRLRRIQVAYELLVKLHPSFPHGVLRELLPSSDEQDPMFLLRAEAKLPAAMAPWWDARTFALAAKAGLEQHLPAETQARLDARYVQAFATEPGTETRAELCQAIKERVGDLEKRAVPNLESAYQRMCSCITERSAGTNAGMQELLVDFTIARGVSCRCPMPPKQRIDLRFGWKKGQTPHHYGPYSDRKVTMTLDVDPAWHACANRPRAVESRVRVVFYGGATAETALQSRRQLAEDVFHLRSPHDTVEFDGRFLCESGPAFIAYELDGTSDLAILNGKRVAVPIHCE
jgi:hypothetical protein